jgi:hypothetical protein
LRNGTRFRVRGPRGLNRRTRNRERVGATIRAPAGHAYTVAPSCGPPFAVRQAEPGTAGGQGIGFVCNRGVGGARAAAHVHLVAGSCRLPTSASMSRCPQRCRHDVRRASGRRRGGPDRSGARPRQRVLPERVRGGAPPRAPAPIRCVPHTLAPREPHLLTPQARNRALGVADVARGIHRLVDIRAESPITRAAFADPGGQDRQPSRRERCLRPVPFVHGEVRRRGHALEHLGTAEPVLGATTNSAGARAGPQATPEVSSTNCAGGLGLVHAAPDTATCPPLGRSQPCWGCLQAGRRRTQRTSAGHARSECAAGDSPLLRTIRRSSRSGAVPVPWAWRADVGGRVSVPRRRHAGGRLLWFWSHRRLVRLPSRP